MNVTLRDRVSLKVREITDLESGRDVFGWLLVFIAKRRANAMLRRVIGRRRPGSIAHLSPRLLQDIGLPPDLRL